MIIYFIDKISLSWGGNSIWSWFLVMGLFTKKWSICFYAPSFWWSIQFTCCWNLWQYFKATFSLLYIRS